MKKITYFINGHDASAFLYATKRERDRERKLKKGTIIIRGFFFIFVLFIDGLFIS